MEEEKKYYLGLDVGTNSVGWCVTDCDYNIVKKGSKSLWGARLFDEAETAKDRRTYRTTRRRLKRRRERIDLLRAIFAEEIDKIDPHFFQRMDESFFLKEDRTDHNLSTLFCDKDFDDKDFYKRFPTIYHLRDYLLNSEKKEDIRFIYLAIHHMVKYRGHFLTPNFSVKDTLNENTIDGYFNSINENLNALSENSSDISITYQGNFSKIKDAYFSNYGKKELNKKLSAVLIPEKEVKNTLFKDFLIPLLSGSEVNLSKVGLYLDISDDEEHKISVLDADFDLKIESDIASLGESPILDIVKITKRIYDSFLLGKLMGDGNYSISKVMIERYDSYGKDLRYLKNYVRTKHSDLYKTIFGCPDFENGKGKVERINNYSSYVGFYKKGKTKINISRCSKEDFIKFLKKTLNLDKSGDDQDKAFYEKIADEKFLQKLNGTINGIFPYQLNLYEMDQILKKQAKFYTFINETEDIIYPNGKRETISNLAKIESILTFKIPYYVGPLFNSKDKNDARNVHSRVTRLEGKIYPWNFKAMVNEDASAEDFIRRMLNNCTYLRNCYCLPKNSILFSIYNVLNNLNKIYVDGSSLTNQKDPTGDNANLKELVINELFLKHRIVTKKKLIDYLKKLGAKDIATSTGKELEAINYDIRAFLDFKNIFVEEFAKFKFDSIRDILSLYLSDSKDEKTEFLNKIESIINDIVIFEDKNILERRLKTKYGIEDSAAKRIKSLIYTGYGRLSKEVLVDIKGVDENGEVNKTIIGDMFETSDNFMEALSKYDFKERINERNKREQTLDANSSAIDFLNDLYINPQSKRAILQTYHIVDELKHILKLKDFNSFKYFIEFARTNKADKKRTKSRFEAVKELLSEAKRDISDLEDYSKTVNKITSINPNVFQSDKIFLYFIQLGRDLYTGEVIDLDDLLNYDIDHIIPKSMIKNDSLDNRVLVSQAANREKSDTYPIDPGMLWRNHGGKNAAFAFYKRLKDAKLMSEAKYVGLTRNKQMSEDELDSFVNRQLVATDQSTKGLVELLSEYCDVSSDNIVFSKAENVSLFRQKFKILKSRTANNFHHAHDAYLNVVVGDVISKYFSDHFIRKRIDLDEFNRARKTANPDKIFGYDSLKNLKGEVVRDKNKIVPKVKYRIEKTFDIFTTTMAYTTDNLFSKVQIQPHTESKGNNMIPVRNEFPYTDVDKYGGLTNYNFGSYCLISIKDKKGRDERRLIALPSSYKNPEPYLLKIGIKNYDIVFPKLKINTVIKIDKKKFCVTGKSGDVFLCKNLYERILSSNQIDIIRKIEKLLDKIKLISTRFGNKNKDSSWMLEENFKYDDDGKLIISPAKDDNCGAITLSNGELISFYDDIVKMYSKDIYAYNSIVKVARHLEEKRDDFINLSFYDKCFTLNELLRLLQCNARQSADLTKIGGSKNSGVITLSYKLPSNAHVVLESYTGFYSKEI